MICVDPSKRISAIECLSHEWIKNHDSTANLSADEQDKLNQEIICNLRKYRGESILKKAAMNVLVKHLSSS